MMQIIVNNTVLDTYIDEVVAVTYRVADIAKFGERTLNATNQFKIPATKTNKTALGNPEIIEHLNPYVYTQTAATVKQGGYELIRNGALQIVSATSTEYEIIIYSKVRSFFDAIAGKSLRDLNLSYLDHIQDFTTVTGSYNNTEGYIYPLQDLFANSPNSLIGLNTDFRVDYSLPWVFAKTLFDEIFKQADFAYQADDLLLDQRFDKLLVSHDQSEEDQTISDRTRSNGWVTERQQTLAIFGNPPTLFEAYVHYDIINNTDFDVIYNDTTGSNPVFDVGYFIAPYDGTYNIRFNLNLYNDPDGFDSTLVLLGWAMLQEFASGAPTQNIHNQPATIIATGNVTYPEVVLSVVMSRGDKIYVNLTHENGRENSNDQGSVYIDDGTYFALDNVTALKTYNSPWNITDNLPDISQTDFLLNISKMFGLVFEQKAYSNIIDVRFFKELYENRSIAPDWSDKIQPSTEKVVFSYGDYAQLNELKWKEDATNAVKEIGDSAFSIDNSNLKSATTLFQLDFSASEEVVYQNRMVSIPIYELQDDGSYQNNGSPQPRLVMLGYDVGSIEVTDGENSDTIINIPYTYFFNGDTPIGFNSLIGEYYNNLILSLRNAKQLTAKLRLTAKDVIEKDQLTPVFIRGNYYHVYEIKNFRPNQLIDVTLIKL